jgi:DNA (cytosine-5)-methyltransferase 1
MEDVSVDEVLRLRECVLTNKPYPLLSSRDGPRCAFPASLSKKEMKQQVFYGGRLACRVVNILINKSKAKPHAGIIRHLYAREADKTTAAAPVQGPGLSRTESIAVDKQEDEGFVIVNCNNDLTGHFKRHAQSNSVTDSLKRGSGSVSAVSVKWGVSRKPKFGVLMFLRYKLQTRASPPLLSL